MTNMGFGEVGPVRLRALFPQTYADGEDDGDGAYAYPSEEFKEFWLNRILLPVVHLAHGATSIHWPMDHNNKKWNSRKSSGQTIFSRRYFSIQYAANIMEMLHERVHALCPNHALARQMKGFVIGWEVQGIKLDTGITVPRGEPFDEVVMNHLLETAFHDIDIRRLRQDNVHVDIAVEMALPGGALYFRTSGHAEILETMLGYDHRDAGRLVTRYGATAEYQKDRMCALDAISGFHLKLKGQARGNGVLGAQAYHTEKEIAYQASSDNGIVPLKAVEFLKDPDPTRSNSLHNWIQSCIAALEQQTANGLGNTARWEVTVPLSRLDASYVVFDEDVMARVLVAYPITVIP